MNAFVTLWRRETAAYFRSSIAYVVGIFFLLITGFNFWRVVCRLAQHEAEGDLVAVFFTSLWFWMGILIVAPLLTMRLFAEETRQGTMESLMTAPVTETTVVLAKFFAAYILFLALWLPTLLYPWLIHLCGGMMPPVSWVAVASSYLGVALIGGCFIAVGLLCSILTKHQAVAAMICLAVLGLWLSGNLFTLQFQPESPKPLLYFLSAPDHMRDFATGILDTRAIVWYLSSTVLLLFTSVRILEAHRLR